MCVPIAAALAVAGAVTSAAGAISGGQQADAQGKYEANVANQNAGMEVQAAHDSYTAGVGERRDFWRKVGQTKGQQIAAMAANGIEVDSGSAARLQADTQMLANDDAQNLYRNIEQRTKGHQINATNYVMEAKAAKMKGQAAKTASYFSAASSLIGGAGQAFGLASKVAPAAAPAAGG